MPVELDHLFIFTSVGAPAVEELLRSGFTEAPSNSHPGQGTSCRRVFFRNAYLEFLWVDNEHEAQSEEVKPLHLWERWHYRQAGASPFGIILRPGQEMAEAVPPPFKTWAYRPPFFAPLQMDVAVNADKTEEPLLFYMSFGRRPDRYPIERPSLREHAAGVKEITGLRITIPGAGATSKSLEDVGSLGIAGFVYGEEHGAEVTFDEGKRDQVRDLRPGLPLILRW